MVASRQARMTIDLGGEQVVLEKMRCSEALGQPFTLTVDIVATLGEVDLLPHLGKPIAVALYEDDELMRHFHGFVTEGEYLHDSSIGFHYRLVAHPFSYFLSQNRDMAIFQDLSVPDIIEKVFGTAGVSTYELKLSGSYPKRNYCVQYRESDFGFVTRLMEEEGIYYYYRHTADKHLMVLCDAPSAHVAGTPAALPYNPSAGSIFYAGSGARSGTRHPLESIAERVSSGGEAAVTLRAFSFKKPGQPLEATKTDTNLHPTDTREVYDYPAFYTDGGRGATLSAVRLAALRRERQVYACRSQATGLACGTKVTVTDHVTARFNQTYLITRTEHTASSEQHRSGADADDADAAHVVFDAIPETTAFHLPQTTPRPRADGLETAIVSGPAGEEIHTDEYGRVKVRFHWDRADTTGENSTCWIRVAQFGNLGSLILPRVNQEVMVSFLHGHPDEPIITGWVFNKSEMPLYGLPGNKTRSLWRTKTYGKTGAYPNAVPLDTGKPSANELRFEDKGGHEEVFLHAERDMNTRIRLAETKHIGQNQELKVGYDRIQSVGHDETKTIDRDQKLTVKRDQTEEISEGNRKITIMKGDDTLMLDRGNLSIKASLGKIEIEAQVSITLTVGMSKITIDQKGVSIVGTMLKNEATGQSSTNAPVTEVKGGAVKVQGGLVTIN